jgi:hypothetical protein
MQKNELLFEDYAEKYYSSVTYDRFYEVVAAKDHLTHLLMAKESLSLLQEESKTYQRTVYYALAGSLLLLYPISKLLPVGGFQGRLALVGVGAGVVGGAVWWANNSCRASMVALKERIYSENRPNFRKYELTGDILQANRRVVLVDQ